MVMRASEIIGRRGVNIASMEVLRRGKGEQAFMRIDLDAPLPVEDVAALRRRCPASIASTCSTGWRAARPSPDPEERSDAEA